MAGTFSNRKVARAARAGGSRRRSDRPYGFYFTCLLIVILGSVTVWYSIHEKEASTNYGSTPPLAPIPNPNDENNPLRPGDHWYEAVGFYTCDKFAPNINNPANPYGLSTNNDGVIHIAPFQRKYAGHNSTLGLFAKAVGLKVSLKGFQLPGDKTSYMPGPSCNGKPGEFIMKEWTNASDPGSSKVIKADPNDVLLEDNHAVVLAWVPQGTDQKDIPLPPSAPNLASVKASEQAGSGSTGTTPSSTPVPVSPTPASTPPTSAAK